MNQISSHISNNSFSISVDSISLQSNDIIEEENMNSSNNKNIFLNQLINKYFNIKN